MPVDMSRYPKDWKDISIRIRKRSRGRCECTGECGSNHRVNHRFKAIRCPARNKKPHPVTGSIVILTVAHLGTDQADGKKGDKHNKQDCRDENLKAMCQRCHLNFDRDEHVQNAKATRRRKMIDAGQKEFIL